MKSIINQTDIKIMNTINGHISVMDLSRKIGIAYNNFLPHLKNLKEHNFINIKENGKGKRKIISITKKGNNLIEILK